MRRKKERSKQGQTNKQRKEIQHTHMYIVCVYMYMYMYTSVRRVYMYMCMFTCMGRACTSIHALAMYVYMCRGNEYYLRAACVYMYTCMVHVHVCMYTVGVKKKFPFSFRFRSVPFRFTGNERVKNGHPVPVLSHYIPFRSVPFRSIPFRSGPFRSFPYKLPRGSQSGDRDRGRQLSQPVHLASALSKTTKMSLRSIMKAQQELASKLHVHMYVV